MTPRRKQQLDDLRDIQNHPHFGHVDILTITGFMTDNEVDEHIKRNREVLIQRGWGVIDTTTDQ